MKIIDIHTHGIGGYDTKTTLTRDILEIARIQGSRGVSEILPTIYPGPLDEMRQNIAAVREAWRSQAAGSWSPAAGLDSATEVPSNKPARILGVHLEGPFLNPLRCGALDPTSFLNPALDTLNRLIEGFEDIVKIITLAPELDGATRLIRTTADKGIIVSMGHSDATFGEAEAGFQAGAKGITHIFNAMRPFHHREPGIAGFGLINKHVYIEVIADPFHLHPETIKMVFAVKDPAKIIIVSDSVKETKSGQRADAMAGITDSKGVLKGGSMTVTEAAERLVQLGIDEDLLMSCITSNPSSYLRAYL